MCRPTPSSCSRLLPLTSPIDRFREASCFLRGCTYILHRYSRETCRPRRLKNEMRKVGSNKAFTKKAFTKKAFTLIELLVVLAIIAILAAMIFPVFLQAREKARQVTCASNERQLAMGILQYVQDSDDLYPWSY